MTATERREVAVALERAVRDDPNNTRPLTQLWWGLYQDVADADVAEVELRHEIDELGF
jgi:hypothetical protein